MEARFSFKGFINSIQCNKSDIMKDIFQKYVSKAGLDINNLYFLYGGNIINKELSVKDIANQLEDGNNILNILVSEIVEDPIENNHELKQSNIIVCSICKGICRLAIKNYKITLYACENGHIINDILVNDFNETQYIDESKIICDICKTRNKNEQYNKQFNYCNICKQKLCSLCKSFHDKNHIIIDYDKKNYLCNKHNDKFISYCSNCNINLCFNCETEHNKKHIIKSFQNFTYTKEELNEIKIQFQERVKVVNSKIDEIIKIMNGLKINI